MDSAGAKSRVDIGIITIREDEFRAVLAAFPSTLQTIHGRRMYELRSIERNDGKQSVVAIVRSTEQGNTAAQAVAYDLLDELAPRWVLVVGIAGARPGGDVSLGDVVVSTRIVDVSVGAALPEGNSEFAHGGGPILLEAAKIVANLPACDHPLREWASAIPYQRPSETGNGPQFIAGAILSSDLLMRDPARLREHLRSARQVLACEMESAGIYRVTHDRQVPFLAIRGISDIVGVPRDPAWTRYAAASAAAFTKAFLCMGAVPVDSSDSPGLAARNTAITTNVFLVYASEESAYASELEAVLAPQYRGSIIHVSVGFGKRWGEQLRAQLASAKIVVVLLSPDFLASKHCCDDELEQVARRSAFGQARMYLVLAHSCEWQTEPFLYKRLFWEADVPMCRLLHRDQAWAQLAGNIVEAGDEFDEHAALMRERHERFFRAPKAPPGLSFARVCVDPTDELWYEETSPSLPYPSPFTAEPGQYIFLRDLFYAENGGIALNLDITLMNQSAAPIILNRVGIEIIAVAHIPDGYGDGAPVKIRKMDSYAIQLPDVRKMLVEKFPGRDRWERIGPIALDLPVSISLRDPILIPSVTPYRFGLQLVDFTTKLPNHSLIRAWVLTDKGEAASTAMNVFTY